jgi:hypothetical protein
MPRSTLSRRDLLKTTAITAAATVSAPTSGIPMPPASSPWGVWDHWVRRPDRRCDERVSNG